MWAMIKVTIRQAAKKRGIVKAAHLARVVGVQEAVAGRWWKWRPRPKNERQDPIPTLESLSKICDALDCELSDLIVRNGKKRRK